MKGSRSTKTKRPASPGHLTLRLYVAGGLATSAEATANLQALCNDPAGPVGTIEIIDVLQDPARALQDGVIITPTLVRLAPGPVVRIFGTLSDTVRVRAALGHTAPPSP